ncbi:MAG: DUF6778 family protein [Paracoccaceae bacterium]
MKPVRAILLVALGLSVSACANVQEVTRNAPYETTPGTAVPVGTDFAAVENPDALTVTAAARDTSLTDTSQVLQAGTSPVTVQSVAVRVSRKLKVNEANSYYPNGDIVWRGDPIGDRHAQVQKIFEDSMMKGVESLNGPVPVDLVIDVKRFHGVSEKARYTVGGVHSITFDLAIKNAETGELIVPVREIKSDLDALGGKQAVLADSRGETQKIRVSNHLAEVIRQELTNPEGYKNANLGFFQLVNSL